MGNITINPEWIKIIVIGKTPSLLLGAQSMFALYKADVQSYRLSDIVQEDMWGI